MHNSKSHRPNQDDQDMPYVPPASPTHSQAPILRHGQRTRTKVVTGPVYDSDEEAAFESDGGDATEDEYLPTPPPNALKRRRSREPISSPSPSVSPSSSHQPSSSSSSRPNKCPRTSRRGHSAKKSKNDHKSEQWTIEDDDKWRCPHQHCDHRQWNKRGPDLRRHQRTHAQDSNPSPYVCWGVPLEHAGASRKAIPGPADKKRGIAVEYQGVMRIGGCFESFSRLDALKRHLEKTKKGQECATDFDDFHGFRKLGEFSIMYLNASR